MQFCSHQADHSALHPEVVVPEQREVLDNVSFVHLPLGVLLSYHLLFYADTQFKLIAVDNVVLVQACLGQREVLNLVRYLRRWGFISAIISLSYQSQYHVYHTHQHHR